MKWFFSAIWRYIRQTDLFLIFITLSASAFGSVLVFSATHGSKSQMITQVGAILLGIASMIVISKIDYHDFAALWKILAVAGVILLLVPYLHPSMNAGSEDLSWLKIGSNTVQPSEFVKIIFVITFAKHYDMVKDKLRSIKTILLLCVHAAVPIGIIVLQKDMGMALVFILIFVIMIFAGNLQLRYFAAAGVLLLVSAPLIWNIVFGGTQRKRIFALFDPTNPLYSDTAAQQISAQKAIGSGELWGYGLFHGPRTQSTIAGMLPERRNDMIFAVAGEELGFIGCMAVIVILVVLLLRLIMNAWRAKDSLGAMICVGIFASFTVQMLINLGMVLMVMPVIGISLPFFSSGGSTTLSSYLAIGVVLSVHMHRKTSMFSSQEKS
jgi:rod shape determining protein RodA